MEEEARIRLAQDDINLIEGQDEENLRLMKQALLLE